jgi:hypothetical protein
MKELIEIQKELKAPKNQRNNFGKYNYRSCEDILEAVKPLAHKNGCVVLLADEVKIIGDRIYVCATAMLYKNDKESIKVDAWAREPEIQKGMNEAQITGSASSYARKYALNGLFAIDDTKDADTDEHHNKTTVKPKLKDDQFKKALDATPEQIKAVISKFDLDDNQKQQLNSKL